MLHVMYVCGARAMHSLSLWIRLQVGYFQNNDQINTEMSLLTLFVSLFFIFHFDSILLNCVDVKIDVQFSAFQFEFIKFIQLFHRLFNNNTVCDWHHFFPLYLTISRGGDCFTWPWKTIFFCLGYSLPFFLLLSCERIPHKPVIIFKTYKKLFCSAFYLKIRLNIRSVPYAFIYLFKHMIA